MNAVTEQISGKQTKGGQMQSFVELLAVEAQNQVVMLNPQPGKNYEGVIQSDKICYWVYPSNTQLKYKIFSPRAKYS